MLYYTSKAKTAAELLLELQKLLKVEANHVNGAAWMDKTIKAKAETAGKLAALARIGEILDTLKLPE